MKGQQFWTTLEPLLGAVLRPHGFSSTGSSGATFHRVSPAGVYHLIAPDRGTGGDWFDVKVFATLPALDPLFKQQFPDNLGIPSDSFSYLSRYGIGVDQMRFSCRTVRDLREEFDGRVRQLLETVALPYLDRLQTLQDALPTIRHPLFLAIAYHHSGRKAEAKPLLEAMRQRLSLSDASSPAVSERMRYLTELLATY